MLAMKASGLLTLASLFLLLGVSPLAAQSNEAQIVTEAATVLNEIMAVPARQIPESLLADAQGIVIIPNLVKGGFMVGLRFGRGVAVIRDEQGCWRPPIFVTIAGGSFGWQVGLQAIDLILVFKTRSGVERLMQGKFTIGADAAAAAGPVGRQAAAATDLGLRAEILSYSRSRGLFAGVAIDGSVLQVDPNANAVYYAGTGINAGGTPTGQPVQLPPSAARLLEQLAAYTALPPPAPGAVVVAPGGAVAVQALTPAADPAATRRQLAAASGQLSALLDDTWRSYLALPEEVYREDRSPSVESLTRALARFEAVASNPQYQPLARRAEFQATYGLLRAYVHHFQTARNATPLTLPPPPK